MAEYNFNKDIILGEKGEDQVIKDLLSLGGKLMTKNDNNKLPVRKPKILKISKTTK